MWVLQPLFRLFAALMQLLGITRFATAAPKGLASTAAVEDPEAEAALAAAARQPLHPASTSIERRTFARSASGGTAAPAAGQACRVPSATASASLTHLLTQKHPRTASHPPCWPASLPACRRVFPDGMSVLRQLFRGVRLQEACFRDVVILYRAAVPDAGVREHGGREHVRVGRVGGG
jgi:hypothetical protein